nr:uncharacterized protein LOC109173926 [Ipomoea trifida]
MDAMLYKEAIICGKLQQRSILVISQAWPSHYNKNEEGEQSPSSGRRRLPASPSSSVEEGHWSPSSTEKKATQAALATGKRSPFRDDLSELLDQIDAYVAIEEDRSNPNVEDSDDEYIDEIREPIADRTNVLKDLHVHGLGYTPSPPAVHCAATQDPALNFVWETISAKNFICQKKLLPKDFNSITMLAEVLKFVYSFQTVVKVDGFVRPVVYEFYANLVPELIREGKSYLCKGLKSVTRSFMMPSQLLSMSTTDYILTGAHVDDLVMPDDDVGPSSATDTIGLTIAFLENELSLLHDQWKILTAREALITSLLSTLRKDVHDRESPDCTVPTSLESTSSFASSDKSVSF